MRDCSRGNSGSVQNIAFVALGALVDLPIIDHIFSQRKFEDKSFMMRKAGNICEGENGWKSRCGKIAAR